jgi:hypothetical protein
MKRLLTIGIVLALTSTAPAAMLFISEQGFDSTLPFNGVIIEGFNGTTSQLNISHDPTEAVQTFTGNTLRYTKLVNQTAVLIAGPFTHWAISVYLPTPGQLTITTNEGPQIILTAQDRLRFIGLVGEIDFVGLVFNASSIDIDEMIAVSTIPCLGSLWFLLGGFGVVGIRRVGGV